MRRSPPGRLRARAAPPVSLIIGRPAMFMIQDLSTGALLFVGRLLDPR